jgi:hypothetical protein
MNTKQEAALLIEGVYKLLSHEDRWCREGPARDSSGELCSPFAAQAIRWSLYGAVRMTWRKLQLSQGSYNFTTLTLRISNINAPNMSHEALLKELRAIHRRLVTPSSNLGLPA